MSATGGGGGAGQEEEKKPGEQSAHINLKVKDPIYVAYHDEEWGVPGHDDKLLFEYLVLSVAQVGSDWTQIANKRENFRMHFQILCRNYCQHHE